MLAHIQKQAVYILSEDGVSVEKYDIAKLYAKLKSMDEFSRRNLIKEVNAQYGSDTVNYKLLQQIYEQDYIKVEESVIKQEESVSMDDFAKSYQKAYMKMMSV